ncbi:hypothetical protein LTS10_010983 [Elasticomyces elasticus]|nr:hypothetical protein LTS10_010983 [Elasticomyces elasticus]
MGLFKYELYPETPATPLPAKHLNYLKSIQILVASCCQDLKYVHCLVANAIVLAKATGQEPHEGADRLDELCVQVASECRITGFTIGKVLSGSATKEDVLRGLKQRCRAAVGDIKQAEKLLRGMFKGDLVRKKIVGLRVLETRERLEDGVMWRFDGLEEVEGKVEEEGVETPTKSESQTKRESQTQRG